MYLIDMYLRAREVLDKMGIVRKIRKEGEFSWYYRLLSLHKQKKTYHPTKVVINVLKHYSKEYDIGFDILKEVFCEEFPALCRLCRLEHKAFEKVKEKVDEEVEGKEGVKVEEELIDVEEVMKKVRRGNVL